ncbi:MAG: CDP-diacylglycerol--glycerol-3-phosphate 3-phosphatidyltransferase [Rickettsiales bacterium]|nr:CDP-diacylglycerol--glycerol-3-phosphate 3-phosphatidyltransferase [Rickettsiales bacterium]
MKNIPNFLTTFRIVIIPVLIAAFYIPGMVAHVIAAMLFAIAAITDYFDGYFARMLKVQSKFGKCLDPIADKLLVIVAIVMLINFNNHNLWILIPGLIIICREVLVSGLREFLAELRVSVPVSVLAKYKTMVQMVSITGLLLGERGFDYTLYYLVGNWIDMDIKFLIWYLVVFLSKVLFCLAAALTVITGYSYFKVGLKHM